MTDDDDKLRALVRATHADDDPPPFRKPQPKHAPRGALAVAALGALAAVAAAWLWWGRATTPPAPAPAPPIATRDFAIHEPASPTEFLLATPGADLLTTTPTFGAVSDLTKGTSL